MADNPVAILLALYAAFGDAAFDLAYQTLADASRRRQFSHREFATHARGPLDPAAFRLVREHIPFLDRDRYLDQDIATTVALIQSGAMSEFVG